MIVKRCYIALVLAAAVAVPIGATPIAAADSAAAQLAAPLRNLRA